MGRGDRERTRHCDASAALCCVERRDQAKQHVWPVLECVELGDDAL